jgi:hypothetical protein
LLTWLMAFGDCGITPETELLPLPFSCCMPSSLASSLFSFLAVLRKEFLPNAGLCCPRFLARAVDWNAAIHAPPFAIAGGPYSMTIANAKCSSPLAVVLGSTYSCSSSCSIPLVLAQ